MSETDLRESGKIYDLAAIRRARAARRDAVIDRPAHVPTVGGGAWYHEAAIRDDDRTRRT